MLIMVKYNLRIITMITVKHFSKLAIAFMIWFIYVTCGVAQAGWAKEWANDWNNEWTTADKQRQLALTGLFVVDWGQTLNIADNPEKFSEHNIFLGKHPSRNRVNTHFVLAISATWVAAFNVEPEIRSKIQWLAIGYQSLNVLRNHKIGLRIKFKSN